MDTFIEYIVKKKKTAKDYLTMAAIITGVLLLAVLCLLFNSLLFGIPFILFVFCCWGAYMLITSSNVEFEYILTNSELDIDKIIARRARKRILTVNFREIEICAKPDDPSFKHIYDNTAGISRIERLHGDINSGNVYFVDFSRDSEKVRVLFEPNERILNEIKKINPRRVNI
ncbi:MAG: hypothetical protein J1F64_02065 [Oscillospiraceae bacterium]|nr:hypothetical protein [Oscillospiraceae bacterium]